MGWGRLLDWVVTIAAALVVPAVICESHGGSWHTVGSTLDWAIWIAFTVEILFYLRIRETRKKWLRSHPLELAVVVLTPPFAPAAIQTIRFFRVLRLIRLLRLARSLRHLMSLEGLKYVGVLAGLAIVGGGEAFASAEGVSSWDGVWWAIVTASTVGYGDVTPHTVLGRSIAIGLIFIGVGFVAVMTGALAHRFLAVEAARVSADARAIERAEFDLMGELEEIRQRLDRIERFASTY